MTTQAIVVTFAASLLSGLIGVLVSFYFFNRLEKRKVKIETARKIFGSKHDMQSDAFTEAMNEIMIIFSDSDAVTNAMEELWEILETPITSRGESAADQKMVKLMKNICRDIGIEPKQLTDAYYLRCFTTKQALFAKSKNVTN
ncbi:MAG: hypothetical protein NPIRA02_42580 [Nitrospirales bacterium]|nr:MAG: hypothetical protein NPIRA02_42580 [Nitrospirales bacterium]